MTNDAAAIKNMVRIETVLKHYGAVLNDKGQGRCLFPDRHHNGDADPSMTTGEARVMCWSQRCFGDHGADVFELVGLMENLTCFSDQKRRVGEIGGLSDANNRKERERTIVETYDYVAEDGDLLFQVVRYAPKDFRQRRPDGKGGWILNLHGVRLVLYRLPCVLKAETVLVVEGEKDVDTAYKLGLPQGWAATCNAMGAEKWRPEYSDSLHGKCVVILPDADDRGRQHGEVLARSLTEKAAAILTVSLPHGKELSEWAETGRTAEEFHSLLEKAEPWTLIGAAQTSDTDGIVLISADQIRPQSVEWAWTGRIPLGALTVIGGMPGVGKSTIMLNLAAKLSKGVLDGALYGTPATIVIASAEDSASRTMIPRLIAAGADLSRVKFVQNRREGVEWGITLPDDIPEIEKVMMESDSRMLIIDPLMAHLSGKVNSYRDQDIRRALAPLARLADQRQATVIVVAHLTKEQARAVLERIGGSIGIVAAARSVLIAAQDPSVTEVPEGHAVPRVLAHAKSNLSVLAATIRYETQSVNVTDQQIVTSAIAWGLEVPAIHAEDLVPDYSERQRRHERAEAREWLQASLADGPRLQKLLLTEAEQQGFSQSTLRRAKNDLRVKSDKVGFGQEGEWYWALPEDAQTGKDAQSKESEHLKREQSQKQASDAGTIKEAQGHDADHLNKGAEHLQPYPIGSTITFNGGLGFEESGIVEAHTVWNQYPGQTCYRVKGRTIPHSRVLGVEKSPDRYSRSE